MESHKRIFLCIVKFTLNAFFIHIRRNCIVDIQKRHRIFADTGADKFAQRAVNIHFTRYRNAPACQAAVYITWHKSKLRLECRPAFSGDADIFTVPFVFLNPVKQGQLILRQLWQDFRLLVAGTKLFFHICHHFRNPGIILVLMESFE